jgi:diguanylate cyclase (GGDEF)-like protein/PAS domain S-box-containing protein
MDDERLTMEHKQAEKALLESEGRYRQLLSSITDYVFSVQIQHGRPAATTHGPGCASVTGYSSEEYAADPYLWYRMIHEEDRQAATHQAETMLSGHPVRPLEHRIIHKNGQIRWIKNTLVPYFDQQGRLLSYDGLVSDITERKQAEHKLIHAAYHDGLTNLPNRERFNDRLLQALIQARRHCRMLAVMYLDLDRFKCINETLGHSMGDLLLRSMADRLIHCIREGDTIARLGGDEFILLCQDMAQAQDAALVARKIHQALLKSFILDEQEFYITTSIGISLFPPDGADVDTLIKNADAAMYQAKAQGRNTYQFYSPAINAEAFRNLTLENNLRNALEREEFIMHYQPLVELSSGRIAGAEALVRWQHPKFGLLPPRDFIHLAEETGLIIPLGNWILKTACQQAKAWQMAGFFPLRISVNLSMRQFTHNDVMASVLNALETSSLDPKCLEIELTESMVMLNAEQTIATLRAFKSAGIQVALDDFGTGYSSLSYLKNLPLNKLKLDQSFVSALTEEKVNESISMAIITLAHCLNLQVIAEGVETFEQLELLRSMKCDEVQGFLFSKPLPAAEISELLQDDHMRNGNRRVA